MTKQRTKLTKEALRKAAKIFSYFAPYYGYFIGGLFFLLLSSAATLTFPYILGDVLDKKDLVDINRLSLGLLLIFLANAIFSFFRIYLFEIVTQKGLKKLRLSTFSHLLKLPMAYFTDNRVGELTSRLSNDVSLLQTTFTTTLAEFLRQILTIVGGVALLATISVKLTGFMLLIVPVIAVIAIIFGRFIKKLSKDTQNAVADSNVVVEESLQAISSVKSFTNEKFEVNRYTGILNDIVSISLKASAYRGAFVSFIIFGLFGSIIGVIWYGLVLREAGEITQGNLFSFVLYTVFVGASFGGIADIYAQLVRAIGATEKLLELFDEQEEPLNIEGNSEKISIKGNVTFQNVHFTYDNRKTNQVLNSIDFNLTSGNKLAIVGPSGAGKSTLIKLVNGFYKPTKGTVLIDDQPIESYDLSALRTEIAVVPQEVLLFGGTIEENIHYGNLEASKDEIVEAAKKANAHDFIESFEDGYQTVVGERGIQLSGGQKQRIAIARAILRNPTILILDEATSSLDSESEKQVQDAIDKLLENRTAIVIAHRLSTIKNADHIIYVEKGSIKEQGKYTDLSTNSKGEFKKMLDLQQG